MAQEIVTLLAYNTAISAGVFAAVWLVKTVFRKQLNARLQYMLWGILVLKLLIPFSITTQWSPLVLAQSSGLRLPVVSEQADIPEAGVNLPHQNTHFQADPVNHDNQPAPGDKTAEPQKAVTPLQDAQSQKPTRVDWTAITLGLWLAGVAGCGIWFSLKSRQLRKTVIRSQAGTAPEWMAEMLEKCKHELGLSRHIRIAVQGAAAVPAVMGAFRPVLMVPEGLVKEKDTEKVRHVFMHELMHCKRHDLLALWLLNVLRAVYWFNPLVWLCGRLVCRDMEAACDEMVVKKLGTSHRQRYIETILNFSGKNEFAHARAAMSLNDGCMKMRVRIRSLYMKKTTKRMKATVLVFALLMLFGAFTAGCQPTPEKVIVQSKDNESVAQAIAQSSGEASEIHTYSAPATWQDEAHDEAKSMDITVDAEVVVPVDTWGIYELKPQAITKEDAQKMLKAIVGDVPVYGELTLQSKDQLIEEIARYKAQKASFEEMYANGGSSGGEKPAEEAAPPAPTPAPNGHSIEQLSKEDLQLNIDMFTQMIAEAENKLKTAPDENTAVRNPLSLDVMFDKDATLAQADESGMTITDNGDYRSISVDGLAELGKATPADIYIYYGTGSFGENFIVNFINYGDTEQGFFEGEKYTGQELFKCDIGVEEAAELATEKMREMGFDYLGIAKTQACELLDRKRMEGDRFPECYEFTFTRELDGAMTTFARGDGVVTQEEKDDVSNAEYTPIWRPGEVTVYVDDSGIIGINISAAKSEVNRQAFGIELKEFPEIMDIFKQQVFIKNAYGGPGSSDQIVRREIRVSEIRLGYMPVPWKDHEGQIIFTPVWDFFGDEVVTFMDGIGGDLGEALDDNNAITNNLGIASLLTINALDGTIIDRDIGS